jgi:preprotein translocase subunit SecF
MNPKMFQKKILPIFILLFTISIGFSQTENTLENQFDDVYNSSNNYKEYKVVKRTDLNFLKKSTLDSIAVYKIALVQMQGELESQKIELGLLQDSLKDTQDKLEKTEQRENEISFLGIQTSKAAYNSMVWTIIIALAIILFFFVYKFRNSNVVTRETLRKLDEVEKEYELHRQRALEREQQLNRKLLDEINKHK